LESEASCKIIDEAVTNITKSTKLSPETIKYNSQEQGGNLKLASEVRFGISPPLSWAKNTTAIYNWNIYILP